MKAISFKLIGSKFFFLVRYFKSGVGNLAGQIQPTRYFNAAHVWFGRSISIPSIKMVLFYFIKNQSMTIEM